MTLQEAKDKLAQAQAAVDRVQGTASTSGSQEYQTGGMRFVRAPLETLIKERNYWQTMVNRMEKGGAVTNVIFGTRI